MGIQAQNIDLSQLERVIKQLHSVSAIRRCRPEICYVLSGGAAKGFAHLGMIDVLQQVGFNPSSIVGCSAGSLVGGVYAHSLDAKATISHFKKCQEGKVYKDFSKKYFTHADKDDRVPQRVSIFVKQAVSITKLLTQSSYIAAKDAEPLFKAIYEGLSFDSCKVPFSACVADLVSGQTVLIDSGDLAKAVMASSSIFCLFPVVNIGRDPCTDGGAISNLPSEEASRKWPNSLLLGFDVSSPLAIDPEKFSSKPIELLFRVIEMSVGNRVLHDRALCDFVFCPIERVFDWSSFDDLDFFVTLGRKHAEEKIVSFIKVYLDQIGKNIASRWNPFIKIAAGIALVRARQRMRKIEKNASLC